jgi:UDP-glucuronate decarboxylase
MKILVTGGAGFIGSALVRMLVSLKKYNIFVLHRKDSNLFRLIEVQDKINYIEGDIFDSNSYYKIKNIKPDIVYHLSWYAEPGKYLNSLENLKHYESSVNFIEFLFKLKIHKIIVTGTCFEYDASYEYLSETTPEKPTDLYSSSKLALKAILNQLSNTYNIPVIWARIFHLYGQYENEARLIPHVINSLINNRKIQLKSHGLQIRDYLNVNDVAQALIYLLKAKETSTYNIGSGNPVRIKDLIMQIGEILNKRRLISFASSATPLNEPSFICSKIEKIKNLGFKEKYSIKKYLEDLRLI